MSNPLVISYSRSDLEFVKGLAADISRAGLSVWFDQNISPGQNWTREIQNHFRNARAILVVLTPASVESDYVDKEIQFARTSNRALIPVLLEECEVPLLLQGLQYLSVRNGKVAIGELQEAIEKLEAPTEQGESDPKAVRLSTTQEKVKVVLPSAPQPPVIPEPTSSTGKVAVTDVLPWLAQQCSNGKLSCFVGPRASASAGLPLRDRLVEQLRREVGREDPDCDDMAQLASWYAERHSHSIIEGAEGRKGLLHLIHALYQTCRRETYRNGYGEIYPRLAQLPIANIYNANWDRLLEDCLTDLSPEPPQVWEGEAISKVKERGAGRNLIQIHGRLNGPAEHFLVTSEDFSAFSDRTKLILPQLIDELDTGNVLLCLGFGYADLSMVAEYLTQARVRSQSSRSLVYALFGDLSSELAAVLARKFHIYPISLSAGEQEIDARICRFLDCLKSGVEGCPEPFDESSPEAASVRTQGEEQVEQRIQHAQEQLSAEGLLSARQWFVNLPERELPVPNPPPPHPLLDSVYVDREMGGFEAGRSLKEWIKTRLASGEMAGITGLLGMGGVGKTYLALKVAWEMYREGWRVVWVSLQERGAEEALDALAEAFQLRFAEKLKEEEKAVALKWLFDQMRQTRLIVVLDNAEQFPNLRLVLQPLAGLSVLVTSRTEECNGIVQYRRLQPMSDSEAIELCQKLLAHNPDDPDLYSRLTETDRQDLVVLCRHLGGHPLGIRLALAGYLNLPRRERLGQRPFHAILKEVTTKGVDALPSLPDLDTGQAGERIHQTIYSTFQWLYSDLPEISPEAGVKAQILLPVIAVLGAVPVKEEILKKALEDLRDRYQRAFLLVDQNPDGVVWDHPVVERGLEWEDREASSSGTAEGAPPDHSPPPPPPGAPVTEEDRYDEEDLRALEQVGDYRFGSISARAACDDIQIGPHEAELDEESFLRRLRSSISLSMDEKLRILKAIPTLSQPQLSELERILDEEYLKFQRLSPKHLIQLKKLEEKYVSEWYQIRLLLENPDQLAWATHLQEMCGENGFAEAWTLLEKVSLILTDSDGQIQIAPLIREHAFAERNRAEVLETRFGTIDDLTTTGPAVSLLLTCGAAVLGEDPENAESFLDLVPRIKQFRQLASTVCNTLWKWFHKIYHERGDWLLSRQILESGVELSRAIEGHEKYGYFLSELGELLDRMEHPEGLSYLKEASTVLSSDRSQGGSRRLRWAEAYLNDSSEEGAMEEHYREILHKLRTLHCDSENPISPALITRMEYHLLSHSEKTPSQVQLGLSTSQRFLPNHIWNLDLWMDLCGSTPPLDCLQHAKSLYEFALKRCESKEDKKNDVLNPGRMVGIQETFLRLAFSSGRSIEEINQAFDQLSREAQQAGIRGFMLQASRAYCHWSFAIGTGEWGKAIEAAFAQLKAIEACSPHRREYETLEARLQLMISQLCANRLEDRELTRLLENLKEVRERMVLWGRNDLVGWLLLCEGLVAIRQVDCRSATCALMQSREAFRRWSPGMPESASLLHEHARSLINADKPQFEMLCSSLSDQDLSPPDYQPWQLSRFGPLPERVRCSADGKVMRLVKNGLQCGPDGKERWLYPFYIDEEPVTLVEMAQMAQQHGAHCIIEGEGDGFVAAPDPEMAQFYARWAGKRLPNSHEWHSAMWQLGFGQEPEQWGDWETARNCILNRIDSAIHDDIKERHDPIPARERQVSKAEKQALLEYHWSGQWLTESARLDQGFQEKVVQPLKDHIDLLSKDDIEDFARGLAISTAITAVQKNRILAALRTIPGDRIAELALIFKEEKEKFLDLNNDHVDSLLALAYQARIGFMKILLNPGSPRTLQPEEVFQLEEMQEAQEKDGELEKPLAFVRAVSEAEMDGAWSSMIGKWEQRNIPVLCGNPLTDREWLGSGLASPEQLGSYNVGIRCVIPLFTLRDLEGLEPWVGDEHHEDSGTASTTLER